MIAITGHSAGIGKALYDAFVGKYDDVVGMSRSNGFDITHRWQIIDTLQKAKKSEYSVLINNAYAPDCTQSRLALRAAHAVNGLRIINIGSVSRNRTDAKTEAQISYATDKEHLYATHNMLRQAGFDSRYLELGMCDTEYNAKKDGHKISLAIVVEYVELLMTDGHTEMVLVE